MKILNMIRVESNDEKRADIEYLAKCFKPQNPTKYFGSIGCDSLEINLEEGTEELAEFLAYIEEKHIPNRIIRGYMQFTDEEYARLPYFRMGVCWSRDLETSCEYYGTEVIYEQCERCKSGEVQLTPVRFPVKELSERLNLFFLFPAFIVSNRLKKKLEDMQVTGCTFQKVIDTGTGKASRKYFQMIVESSMPPVSSRTRRTGTCDVCHRDLIDYEGTIQYKASDFFEQKDIYIASESVYSRFAMGSPIRSRALIVSSRVKDILKEFHAAIGLPVYIQGMFEEHNDRTSQKPDTQDQRAEDIWEIGKVDWSEVVGAFLIRSVDLYMKYHTRGSLEGIKLILCPNRGDTKVILKVNGVDENVDYDQFKVASETCERDAQRECYFENESLWFEFFDAMYGEKSAISEQMREVCEMLEEHYQVKMQWECV